jgi:hypothetical protein
MRRLLPALAGLALAAPSLAAAAGPEQLDQLEPFGGDWQVEYFGISGEFGGHALEAMVGLGDRLAVGVEIEVGSAPGGARLDGVGLKALYRVTAADAPVGIGLQLQLGFDARAAPEEAEARLIVETQSGGWWAQGNFMLRHSDEAPALAYAASFQHAVTDFAWLGVEASGQSAAPWRAGPSGEAAGHFAGPSLTLEWEPAGGPEMEIGLAYLRRIGGDGPAGSGRLFAQFTF